MKKITRPHECLDLPKLATQTAVSLFLVAWMVALPSLAATEKQKANFQIMNMGDVAKNLRLDRFHGRVPQRKVKIAILDNGFLGHEGEIGKSLPQNTRYWKGKESDADRVANVDPHGLLMAQLVHQTIQHTQVKLDYELHLFLTAGYTKFVSAIDNVIEQKMDIVLHSQVWEYGGNGDGQGFINAQVSRATQAGVIWVNASGNFERKTHIGPTELDGDWIVTQEKTTGKKTTDGIRLRCKSVNGATGCPLRMILSWNDFKNEVLTGTDKDLDLYLIGPGGKEVAKGETIQKLQTVEGEKGLYPFERVEATIPAGEYRAKIKAKSKNLSSSRDLFRLTVGGSGVEMIDFHEGESLLPPTDHPSVIVIGASDDIHSSRSVKLSKPDALLRSRVVLNEKLSAYSSSTAAAMATAVASLVMGIESDSKRETILARLKEISQKAMTEAEIANELKKSTQVASRAARPSATAPKAPAKAKQNLRPRARLGEEVDPGEPDGEDRLNPRTSEPLDEEPRSPEPRDLGNRPPRYNSELPPSHALPPPLENRRARPFEPRMDRPCVQIRALPYFHQGARIVFRRSAEMGRPARSVQLEDGQIALIVDIEILRSLESEPSRDEVPFATENGIELLPGHLLRSPPRAAYPILPEQAVRFCP